MNDGDDELERAEQKETDEAVQKMRASFIYSVPQVRRKLCVPTALSAK
jgi:hypothetical protein